MKNLITNTPRRPYIIAPTEEQKLRMMNNVDKICSLYYITIGSVYAVCQSAMIDAREFIRTHEPVFYKQQVKYNIKKALEAYDKWDAKMKNTLGEHYQMWLDLSDAVDEEIKPLVTILYYSIDNCLLKYKVSFSKVYAYMETASALIQVAGIMHTDLFDNAQKRTGVDVRPLFKDGDASDIHHYWREAICFINKMGGDNPDVNLNSDPTVNQAIDNIIKRLTAENMYNRSGEYALRLNPDQWKNLDTETRMRLKKGLPIYKQKE